MEEFLQVYDALQEKETIDDIKAQYAKLNEYINLTNCL
jgi:hypothetical protein